MSIFYCKNEERKNIVRAKLQGNAILNGIDYIEINPADQTQLSLFLIHLPPGIADGVPVNSPDLTPDNFIITGGERIKNIRVKDVDYFDNNEVHLTLDKFGDFSTYKLIIVTSLLNTGTLDGFDPILSEIEFSFKVSCPSDFDCKPGNACPPETQLQPEIDYLSKDYNSFRKLIFDRLSIIMPGWQERNPADLQVAMVELMAYLGDHLSYFQDAVGTDAYLGTSRKRISVRRHGRMLDYRINDGCNSRVWIHIKAAVDGKLITAKTPFCTGSEGDGPTISGEDLSKKLNSSEIFFESIHDLTIYRANNNIRFYTWSDKECCLPKGSTKATLFADNNNEKVKLKAGDVIIFKENVNPVSGLEYEADTTHRHAIRIKKAVYDNDPLNNTPVIKIEWYEEDALPFPLCISARIKDEHGVENIINDISTALGNIVLADNGYTIKPSSFKSDKNAYLKDDYLYPLVKDRVSNENVKNLTIREKFNEAEFANKGASLALIQDTAKAIPDIILEDSDGEEWEPKLDLLASDRFANEFVCEIENDGSVYIRFGDDINGKKPSSIDEFNITYRTGCGTAGNIGSDSIKWIITDISEGIESVNNPMNAAGGTDPESIEKVKQVAPYAFRVQERAVTKADYSEVTERQNEVQKAAAEFRWTGSWNTVFITVDRKGGFDVDNEFADQVSSHVERYRMAGHDVEVNSPIYVPLLIEIDVCVKDGYYRSDIKEKLLNRFSNKDFSDGERGYFHPDNFTFGQPVYLSKIYDESMKIEGISYINVIKFERFGKNPNHELEKWILSTSSKEIIRLDNNLSYPENGKILFNMNGGL